MSIVFGLGLSFRGHARCVLERANDLDETDKGKDHFIQECKLKCCLPNFGKADSVIHLLQPTV